MSASAQTIVYSEAFVSGVTPTTQCVAWNTFRSTLLGTYAYTGFKISGSMDLVGISCIDPVIAVAVANALRTGTSYTVFDATATPTATTWTVFAGCTTGLGCSSTPVEFGNIGSCACATGYDLRPDIGNNNWGGINGPTCAAASQVMTVTFFAGPAPPTITGATRYCTGDVVTLTASSTAPGPTYTWSGPGAFTSTSATISFVASLATAGVYSCTVTSAGTPSLPRLDTIVVVDPPTITLSTTGSVCQGTTFAYLPYTATTSSPTRYSIVYSTAAHTAGFTDVTLAPLPVSPIVLSVPAGAPSGSYTGTLTVDNGTCSGPGSPISITINPNPAAITGVTNICTGSTSTLSNITPFGTWSSSNPGVATIGPASGIVTGLTVGFSNMTYTLVSTGCYATALVNVVGISGPDHVCAGSSVNLTTTSTGGLWTSSDMSLATVDTYGVVTGVAMGSVTITYTLGSGCTATWAMTVNPLAPIVGRDSVCVNSIRYLTDIVGGGVWSSSYPAVASVLLDSGKVTGHIAGITTISYLLPTGCLSTAEFTVIDYPGAITGTQTVCPGTNTTLSNATGGGTWTSANTAVATVHPTSGTVTGVYADTVDILYTVQPGCSVYTRVTVNPLPAPITGPNIMCPNTIDTVFDETPGGLWGTLTPSILTIIDTNGAVTAVSSGTGTVKYTLPTGCLQTKNIFVNPLPIPAITYNFLYGTLIAGAGYESYQWYDSLQGIIPLATSPSLAALNTEYYYVEVIDSNGCKGRSPYYHFDIRQLGIKNIGQGEIRIYPNPASDVIHIYAAVTVRAVISDVQGKTVAEKADAKEMNISNLAGGVYIITLYDENGVRLAVQKLVKD